ncbi:T9SS C-terminal target domain-containing protein [candidate division KSB1 bacterium]|nr:MAG: T9SS C-terminal target domain-containing protein [candidate division KSB1 bacterium]MBC6950464.1 T9SS C-terminal target domain-containing protein [candidate division KSB1 bacterium]MCE7941199.1 T9SS C-terminal target domain-containing protein [Chlorobi bacterium CHB1]MDL1878701.1 T9SS type A sorting domain-containing protein [Cytophagia bacterium CHB2]
MIRPVFFSPTLFALFFLTTITQAQPVGGHIPIAHGHPGGTYPYNNAPASSICWGYAQGRAFGRYDGDQECNPAKTYASQIDENNFPYVSGASLSGIELGDIVVFGTIRQGANGHAAFVIYIPPGFDGSEAAIRNIKVDQVPAQNLQPQHGILLNNVIPQQGMPVGYHEGNGLSGGGPLNALVFRNSFGGGVICVGQTMSGTWCQFPGTYIERKINTESQLWIHSPSPQEHEGITRKFREWTRNGSHLTYSNPHLITVDGAATYEAVFDAYYDVTFKNQFPCGAGNGGVIVVNSQNKSSPHTTEVKQEINVTARANNQTYNGVIYNFSNWSNGSTNPEITFIPNTNVEYVANYVVVKPQQMSYFNLHVSSSPGQYIQLAWNQHPNSNVTYQVWRRAKPAGGSLGPPVLKATLANNVTSWTDYDYLMTSGYTHDLLEYDVRSYYVCGSTAIAADANYITVFGNGGIIPKATADPLNEETLPQSFAIQASPNPFVEATTLRYQLPSSAHLVLEVYDLNGRRLEVLSNGLHNAGNYSVVWQSVASSRSASGVYLYRFLAQPTNGAAPFVKSGKLVRIK